MNNYKVNVKYGTENINDIFIKVLNKELKKYLRVIYKSGEKVLLPSCINFSTIVRENNNDR